MTLDLDSLHPETHLFPLPLEGGSCEKIRFADKISFSRPLDMGGTSPFPIPRFFHSFGEGRVGAITSWNLIFFLVPPHPTLLPQGERGFPDEN